MSLRWNYRSCILAVSLGSTFLQVTCFAAALLDRGLTIDHNAASLYRRDLTTSLALLPENPRPHAIDPEQNGDTLAQSAQGLWDSNIGHLHRRSVDKIDQLPKPRFSLRRLMGKKVPQKDAGRPVPIAPLRLRDHRDRPVNSQHTTDSSESGEQMTSGSTDWMTARTSSQDSDDFSPPGNPPHPQQGRDRRDKAGLVDATSRQESLELEKRLAKLRQSSRSLSSSNMEHLLALQGLDVPKAGAPPGIMTHDSKEKKPLSEPERLSALGVSGHHDAGSTALLAAAYPGLLPTNAGKLERLATKVPLTGELTPGMIARLDALKVSRHHDESARSLADLNLQHVPLRANYFSWQKDLVKELKTLKTPNQLEQLESIRVPKPDQADRKRDK